MCKTVLINPPRDNVVHLDLKGFIDLGDISSFPPIGLMYLAQALRQDSPKNEVVIIDCVAERMDFQETARCVRMERPDLVGLTSFSYTFYDVLETAKAIRTAGVEVPLVVGGAHMFIFPMETMQHGVFDYGVVGDGEEVLTALCASIREGRPAPEMTGLYSIRGGEVIGKGVAQVKDLNAVQAPAIDLIDPFRYYSTIGKRNAVGAICTSRGCPFRCTFCQVPRTSYRMRSVENVVDEIEMYMNRGITDFFFFDDLFNISKKRVAEFSQEVLRRKLKIGWMFRGRVDQIDLEIMTLAVKAGCHTVSVGVEDYTDEGLKIIHKNITIDQAFSAARAIRKSGAQSSSNWIIGFPHHKTKDDLEDLYHVAVEMDTDFAQFSVLQCLPGTELWDQAVAEGDIDENYWRVYVQSPTPDFQPPIWEKHFQAAELFKAYSAMYRRYYTRPKFVIRQALATRSMTEFLRKIRTFFKIFLSGD